MIPTTLLCLLITNRLMRLICMILVIVQHHIMKVCIQLYSITMCTVFQYTTMSTQFQ